MMTDWITLKQAAKILAMTHEDAEHLLERHKVARKQSRHDNGGELYGPVRWRRSSVEMLAELKGVGSD